MGIVAGSMLFIFMQVGGLQKDDDFAEGHLEPHQVRRKLSVNLIKDKNNTAQERTLNQVDGHHQRRMAMKEFNNMLKSVGQGFEGCVVRASRNLLIAIRLTYTVRLLWVYL